MLIRPGWGAWHRGMSSLRLVRRAVFDAMALADRGFGWNVEMPSGGYRHLQHPDPAPLIIA